MLTVHISVGIFLITATTFALMGIVSGQEISYILTWGPGLGLLFGLMTLIVGAFAPKRKKSYESYDLEAAEKANANKFFESND